VGGQGPGRESLRWAAVVSIRAGGRDWPVRVAVVSPLVCQPDGSVIELGEGLVEGGVCDAITVDVEFCKEGLIETAAFDFSGLCVELLAVFQQAEGDLKAFLDESGVGLREREEVFGFTLLGVERRLAAFEVDLGDRAVEVGIDQFLALGRDSLDPSGLGADELLVVSSLLAHLAVDPVAWTLDSGARALEEVSLMARPSKYTPEFRREALELIRSSGRTIAEVARSLGISDGTLGNWVKADREARERSADPAALTESERDELRRLRKEVAELQLEREILRKAAAYFARETIR
jgi:transposase